MGFCILQAKSIVTKSILLLHSGILKFISVASIMESIKAYISSQKAGVIMSSNIEKKISAVDATMAMEGMPLTDEDKNRIRDIFAGKLSVDKIVDDLVKKHSQKAKITYE